MTSVARTAVDLARTTSFRLAEADGALKYADPDRARQQLRRDADLRDAGFEVVHISWRELAALPRKGRLGSCWRVDPAPVA